jgi:hypothetical protein
MPYTVLGGLLPAAGGGPRMPSLSKRLMQHVASPLMRLGAGRPFLLRARELILGLPQRPNARARPAHTPYSRSASFLRLIHISASRFCAH